MKLLKEGAILHNWPLPVALCLIVTGFAFVSNVALGVAEVIVATAVVNVIYTVGLYVFVGNSGIISFGNAAFASLGAYTVGVLTIPSDAKSVLLNRLPEVLQLLELPTPLALLCAVVVAGSIAAVFGLAVMRLRGIAAGILTLSFLVVVYETLTNWRVLGSSGTITRIPYETTPFVAAVVACAAIVVAWLFQNSKTGLSLRAARDEENAARAMGVNVTSVRLVAFVLSAAIMAVGGGLSAQLTSTISPGAFFLNLTFLTIGMLVVGGMHRLSGAVLGALVISVVNEGLRQFEAFLANAGMPVFGLRDLALAVAIVLILMFRTEGLVGSTEFKIRLGKKNAKPTGGKQE